MNYSKYILIFSLMFQGFLSLNAQVAGDSLMRRDTIIDLPAEEVEVIKQFQARLEDARKINVLPERPAQRKIDEFNYDVNIRPLELTYLDPTIRPIAMLQDPKPEKYNGYALGGYGTLNTINAALGYNYLSPRETEINFMGDYLSMNDRNELVKKYSHINTLLDINHNVGALLALGINAGFKQKGVGFFGSELDSATVVENPDLFARTINRYQFGLNAYNGEANVYNFNYKFGFNYENLQLANENLAENNFIAGLNVNKAFNDHFSVYLEGTVDISSIIDTATTYYNNYIVKPGIHYSDDRLNLNAAIGFAFDQVGTHYLPDVKLSFNTGMASVVPYLFYEAQLQKNNISPLYEFNPFLSNSIVPNLGNSYVTQYGLGVQGIAKGLNYDVTVSYGNTQDLLLFNSIREEENIRRFRILKDTANILKVQASIGYDLNQQFSIRSDIIYRNYDLALNARPWHLPAYQFDVSAEYRLLDQKLKLEPKIYLRQGVFVINKEGFEEQLIPLLDFNFGVTYDITKRVSAFARVHNILSSEYQLWEEYTYYGINVMGGIKAVF